MTIAIRRASDAHWLHWCYCSILLRSLPVLPIVLFVLFVLFVPMVAVANEAEQAVTVTAPETSLRRYQVPATQEGIDAQQMTESVNVVNTEDALKYLPSLVVRKRRIGDQQAPLATRTSGLGQSARSLIYADGYLLSSLIGNNNSSASPRWALVTPEEIERIDVMYGPFSAAYPGNSMGAVVEISTRMPQQLEAGAKLQSGRQDFNLYSTKQQFQSTQASAVVGNKLGDLSWWLSANSLDTFSQPNTFITATKSSSAASAAYTTVTGAHADRNRLGADIVVYGAGGLEHKQQENGKIKLAYDLTPQWRASYTLGTFQDRTRARADSYLRDSNGNPVYSGNVNIDGYRYTIAATSFSSTSGVYALAQEHTAQSLALKSDTRGNWDWEAIFSTMQFGLDTTRNPTTALGSGEYAGAGTLLALNGTGWSTLDLKGIWRPRGIDGAHQLSFGVHGDQYKLSSKTSTLDSDWTTREDGTLTAMALGKTSTSALWLQDVWKLRRDLKLTVGGRQEYWTAYGGLNYSSTSGVAVNQPGMQSSNFSPKASLRWNMSPDWSLSTSFGKAYRYPTVTELYQSVTSSGTVYTPNPNLRPEQSHSGELALERVRNKGRLRLSLFQEDLRDALISQNSTISGTTVNASQTQNIDRIRSSGLELALEQGDALLRGLDLAASLTYVDSTIVSNPSFRDVNNLLSDVRGKATPNIPVWKGSTLASYRVAERWTHSLGARYSSHIWATIDNTDYNHNTYQGFAGYFVMDARMHYKLDQRTSLAVGIDNLNNRKYFLFHPMMQRTLMAELKLAL